MLYECVFELNILKVVEAINFHFYFILKSKLELLVDLPIFVSCGIE